LGVPVAKPQPESYPGQKDEKATRTAHRKSTQPDQDPRPIEKNASPETLGAQPGDSHHPSSESLSTRNEGDPLAVKTPADCSDLDDCDEL
jgi:hypothetical protein